MILGTAGHIDHGKTTLVRALTGVDTDRLPEEKRRGITIDLGFAPLALDGVGQVGVIDVPGHEAFVRTMVAGATGVDLALLVIAADSGVMPQTREHLAILSLLGVHDGVVAITKCDLVDEDWLALVEEDVRATLASSSLASAELVRVSATTGEGIDALRRSLTAAALRVPLRASGDLFRLPIDRAFTVKGTGTVVTGTVWSGSLARDAMVRLFPSGVSVRVRGLHAHGRSVDVVRTGERAAVALAGLELDQVRRGALLAQGEAWKPSRVLRAEVALLPEMSTSIGPRSRVRFHLGTSEIGARIVVRDGALDAGAQASARIVLDEPIVARAGDRFVLRAASPVATLGGGVVTDPQAPARARPVGLDVNDPARSLLHFAEEAGVNGIAIQDLAIRLGVRESDVDTLVSAADGWRVAGRFLATSARDRLANEARVALDSFHADHPLEPGAPVQWLRSRLGAADDIASAVLALLATRGELVASLGVMAKAGFAPTLNPAQNKLRDEMVSALGRAGGEPPSIEELAATFGAPVQSVLDLARWLARDGMLVPVEPNRFYSSAAVGQLRERMAAGMAVGREYTPAELRDLLGLTRKFLIPFLEYCDREGYTFRGGLGRRLSSPPT